MCDIFEVSNRIRDSCLLLSIVEVGRDGDNSKWNSPSKVLFSGLLHPDKYHGQEFPGSVIDLRRHDCKTCIRKVSSIRKVRVKGQTTYMSAHQPGLPPEDVCVG